MEKVKNIITGQKTTQSQGDAAQEDSDSFTLLLLSHISQKLIFKLLKSKKRQSIVAARLLMSRMHLQNLRPSWEINEMGPSPSPITPCAPLKLEPVTLGLDVLNSHPNAKFSIFPCLLELVLNVVVSLEKKPVVEDPSTSPLRVVFVVFTCDDRTCTGVDVVTDVAKAELGNDIHGRTMWF
ncbi:hypothetical protein LR48_Vigan02g110200 [Vigna angularis]|uniref:Uncharacterized protein n=1 Tax=Phaseolus angularis TaxID=3914 RepID=A0A0L9TX35_PHAAN|nr:hypothetical protein LR48_Vigan02g110200 [Vigna angularis]